MIKLDCLICCLSITLYSQFTNVMNRPSLENEGGGALEDTGRESRAERGWGKQHASQKIKRGEEWEKNVIFSSRQWENFTVSWTPKTLVTVQNLQVMNICKWTRTIFVQRLALWHFHARQFYDFDTNILYLQVSVQKASTLHEDENTCVSENSIQTNITLWS